MKIKYFLALLFLTVFLASCGAKNIEKIEETNTGTTNVETPKEEGTIAYETTILGEKPSLKDDFYTHMNYDYIKNTKIPVGKTSNGNFEVLHKNAEDSIKNILKDLDTNYENLKEGSDEKKLIDFYRMALDFKTRNELGIKPIQKELDGAKSLKNLQEVREFMLKNVFNDVASSFLAMGVMQDQKNSDNQVLYVPFPISGLEQEFYKDDEYSKNIQKAYKKYMKDLFLVIGYSDEEAEKKMQLTYEFEKELALSKLKKEEKIDTSATYHVHTLAQLEELTKNLGYVDFAKKFGLDKASKIVVMEPKAMKKLNEMFNEKNFEAIRSYIEFKIISSNSSNLSKEILEKQAEYIQAYTGFYHLETEEELAFQLTSSKFENLIGKLYVEKHFSPETKKDVEKMTQKIVKTYEKRIEKLDWLTEETKQKAIKKLETLNVKIGYPEKFEDYSKITVKFYKDGGNLTETIRSLSESELYKNFEKLDKAPDKTEWLMQPQEVNAYYSMLSNEIIFTAAILQEPFYNPNGTFEENLGAIGTVIGHEISHAFDSIGSQYDEKGNINNWWKEEDLKKFQEKVKKAADLYSKLEVVPGYFVNGEISTGEIMADLGGLTVAVDIAKQENLDLKKIFESYSHVWRSVNTKENLINNIIDEHPYGKFRVNNILNLIDEFYETYGITENDKMYVKPEERLKVW